MARPPLLILIRGRMQIMPRLFYCGELNQFYSVIQTHTRSGKVVETRFVPCKTAFLWSVTARCIEDRHGDRSPLTFVLMVWWVSCMIVLRWFGTFGFGPGRCFLLSELLEHHCITWNMVVTIVMYTVPLKPSWDGTHFLRKCHLW